MNFIWPPAPSGLDDVIKAAEALGISEYDFFRLSFRRWSGHEPDDEKLEQVFVAYMFHQTVPPWVRHLVREISAREAEGRLDIRAFGAEQYKRRRPPHRHGRLYVGIMAVMTVFYCVALLDISYDPGTSAPMPCYSGPGFKVISDMAHTVTGREPPVCEPAGDR